MIFPLSLGLGDVWLFISKCCLIWQLVAVKVTLKGNKWSRPESRPKSAGCSRDEMMEEAAYKAERVRASRGNYEIEVTFTGEAGLQQCANLCPKNPGHDNFIPTNNFNIEHLPPRYRDNLLVDWARATSNLTCRLSGSRISEDRPETWPDSEKAFPFSSYKGENSMMVGTGRVWDVDKYNNNNNGPCPCVECHQSSTHTPKMAWGKVYILTANHVVFNTEEARHTKCHFFYDSPETDINTVPTITGLQVVLSEIKGDWCWMNCVTHDVELLDKLGMMYRRWKDLHNKVLNKYLSKTSPLWSVPCVGCDTNVDHDLCIVVSHPHGCTKQISVGTWTQRRVVDKYGWIEYITYRYNTPTCPGSSGAAILTLYKERTDDTYQLPPHSEGGPGNDNNSGVGIEYSGLRISRCPRDTLKNIDLRESSIYANAKKTIRKSALSFR